MNKLLSVITAILLALTFFSRPAAQPVRTQTHAESFLPEYALSGEGGADMVSIAMAQLGMTGSELGYTEEWCADFVCDCALLAGQSAAVPLYGGVTVLRTLILGAGGSVTTNDPRPGDICFIDWNFDSALDHVEIVCAVNDGIVSTIGGNTGGGSSLYSRRVWIHEALNGGSYGNCVSSIVRPAYVSREVGYLERCSSLGCCASVSAQDGAVLRSLPSHDAQVAYCPDTGEEMTAVSLLETPNGELWYGISSGKDELYLFAGDVSSVTPMFDALIENVGVPGYLTVGSAFPLRGTVLTERLTLSRVSAFVYPGYSPSGEPATGASAAIHAKRYSVLNSAVDMGTVFNSLSTGSYTIVFSAAAVCRYSLDGSTLLSEEREIALFSSHFGVMPFSHLPGDADASGAVDISDALLVLRCSMGILPGPADPYSADADGDGTLTISDALIILRLAMGLIQ